MSIGLEFIANTYGYQFKEIAEKLCVKPQVVSEWIKEKRKIPNERLEHLSNLFNLDKSYFQKELSNREKLLIQIHYLEETNETTVDEYVDIVDGQKVTIRTEYHSNQSILGFLYGQLRQEELVEGIKNTIDDLFIYDEEDNQLDSRYIKEVEKFTNFIKTLSKNRDKTSIDVISDITYFFEKFYATDKEKWEDINPFIYVTDHGNFYSELKELIQKYYPMKKDQRG